MNDIVRYDVYSPERDRREFRYLFPRRIFCTFFFILAYVGAYVFGVERTVIAFIGEIAPDEAGVIVDQPQSSFGVSGFSDIAFSSWSIR